MFTDTHAHLDSVDFQNDLEAILQRAQDAGISRIITIGTTVEGSRRAVALADKYPQVYAAVGVHPNNADEAPADFIKALEELAAHPRVVAIGEIGLDYYRMLGGPKASNPELKALQAAAFTAQLDLAVRTGHNVVIHEREAWEDTTALLAPYQGKLRAVFHCFGKDLAKARQLIAANHLVSFTGIVTFKNAPDARQSAAGVPSNAFMLETDCPYLAPVPNRGKRCEPAYTRLTAEEVARLRQTDLATLARQTGATANAFFRFPRI